MPHRRRSGHVGKPRGFFGRIAHFFRERQIYVRSQGEVQFVTVKPWAMIFGIVILLSGIFWVAYAAINVAFKDELLIARERNFYQSRLDNDERLAELQRKIDRLNEKLMLDQQSYLAKVDGVRSDYQQLVERHKILTEFFRQGWMPMRDSGAGKLLLPGRVGGKAGKQNRAPGTSGKVDLNQLTMQQKYRREFTSKKQALAPLVDMRAQMAGFDKMQSALLDEAINRSRAKIAAIRKVFKNLGLRPKLIAKNSKYAAGNAVGGPFVPASVKMLVSNHIVSQMMTIVDNYAEIETLIHEAKRLPLTRPLRNITRITSRFGIRRDPMRRVAAMHTGMDIKAAYRSKIRTQAPGIVMFAGWAGGYGRMVKIRHDNGIETRYAHMAKILVKKNQRVSSGTIVGLLGNSGRSTGAHLHYETRLNGRPINPARFWKANNVLQALAKKTISN